MDLELLAPARDADLGMLALACGADAVYIGGPAFGARKGAGNTVSDVARLVEAAHLVGARVYATLNTILYDGELEAARRIAWDLHGAGVDALIVQDMAFLEMDLPPMPLHASTQAACDGSAKVAFLAGVGFHRAILARELSLAEIAAVRAAVPEGFVLEAFVYGALCVGESGRCALGHVLQGRSGNRGQCVQPCRRGWDLLDREGRVLLADLPLLSIRDLDLTDHLEALAEAGVRSFKIEGRMKDASYLKNAVGHVRRKLDALLARRPDLGAPSGVDLGFIPDPSRTFHRGHTTYGLEDRRRSLLTGAASGWLGEVVGRVRVQEGRRIRLDRVTDLAPGDGVAWPGPSGRVVSTRVEAVEADGILLRDAHRIAEGQQVHRPQRRAWLDALERAVPSCPPRPNRPLPDPGCRPAPLPEPDLDPRWNVSNGLARAFYLRHGARRIEPALECQGSISPGQALLEAQLCLKFEAGQCERHPNPEPFAHLPPLEEPLVLRHEGHRFACRFDCEACRMVIQAL